MSRTIDNATCWFAMVIWWSLFLKSSKNNSKYEVLLCYNNILRGSRISIEEYTIYSVNSVIRVGCASSRRTHWCPLTAQPIDIISANDLHILLKYKQHDRFPIALSRVIGTAEYTVHYNNGELLPLIYWFSIDRLCVGWVGTTELDSAYCICRSAPFAVNSAYIHVTLGRAATSSVTVRVAGGEDGVATWCLVLHIGSGLLRFFNLAEINSVSVHLIQYKFIKSVME